MSAKSLTLKRMSRKSLGLLPTATVLFGELTKTDGICLPGSSILKGMTLAGIKISTVIPEINSTLDGIRTARLRVWVHFYQLKRTNLY